MLSSVAMPDDPALPRACGACSLCCKLLPIAALDKPHDRWCMHCRPGAGGCTIYDSRPQTCRSFSCHWLADASFGDHWAPLKAKMLVQVARVDDAAYECFVDVHVDRGGADGWREEPYAGDLRRFAAAPRTLVRVFQGSRMFIVRPHETLEVRRG